MLPKVQINIQGFGEIVANMKWLLFGKLLRLFIFLFVTAWTARYLGPDNFGMLGYASTVVGLFAALGALGLDGVLVREIVHEPSKSTDLINSAIQLRVFGGFIILAVSVAWILCFKGGDAAFLLMVGLIGLGSVFQACDSVESWSQACLRYKETVVIKAIASVLSAGLTICLILSGGHLVYFAAVILVEKIIGAAGLLKFYKACGNEVVLFKIKWNLIVKLLKEIWPLVLSGLSVSIYMSVDQIMLGQIMDDHAVGIYIAATRITEFTYVIPSVMVAAITPSLYKQYNADRSKYDKNMQFLLSVLVAISAIMILPMVFYSDEIIRIIYSNGFEESANVLRVHACVALFIFLGVAQTSWDYVNKLTHLASVRTITGAILNIILNYMLIPPYGAIGAAYATLITCATVIVVMNFVHSKTRIMFFMQLKSLMLSRLLTYEK
jgi:polysaccharide transporter, PST family